MILFGAFLSALVGGCATAPRTAAPTLPLVFVGRPIAGGRTSIELLRVERMPDTAHGAFERAGVRAGARVAVVWHDTAQCTTKRAHSENTSLRVSGTLRPRAKWVNSTPTVDATLPAADDDQVASIVSGFYSVDVAVGTSSAKIYARLDPRVDSLDWRADGPGWGIPARAWVTAWIGPTLESLSPCLARRSHRTAAWALAWPRDSLGGQVSAVSLDSVAVVLEAGGNFADRRIMHSPATFTASHSRDGRWMFVGGAGDAVEVRAVALSDPAHAATTAGDFGVCHIPGR
jgi:hypothetical protein